METTGLSRPSLTQAMLGAPPLLGIVVLAWGCVRGLSDRGSFILSRVFLGAVLAALLSLLLIYLLARNYDPSAALRFSVYRYLHLSSGVSPFLPLLLLVVSGLWASWCSLSGIFLLSSRGPRLPLVEDFRSSLPAHQADCYRLLLLSKECNQGLLKALPPFRWDLRIYGPATFAIVSALFVLRFHAAVNVVEGYTFQLLFSFLFALCVFVLLALTFRVLIIWEEFHALLRALENLPLRRSFDLLKGFTWRPLWKLAGSTGMMNFYRLLSRELETLRQLRNMDGCDPWLKQQLGYVESKSDRICQLAANRPPDRHEFHRLLAGYIATLHEEMATTAARALNYLDARWVKEQYETEQMVEVGDGKKDAHPGIPEGPTAGVERFVCLFYLNYILVVLRRIQSVLLSIAGMFVFLLLSLNFYPFEPHLSLRTLVITLFGVIMGCVGFVFAQMHKDATLSRITDTRPGELGLDFYLRMGGFVLVPLLSLLAAQFPDINGFLFSWLEPALQALK